MEVFVVINNINFKVKSNSVLSAVDICYKSFYTLNIKFSAECKHIWYFLQYCIYKTSCIKVKSYLKVTKFVKKIGVSGMDDVSDSIQNESFNFDDADETMENEDN